MHTCVFTLQSAHAGTATPIRCIQLQTVFRVCPQIVEMCNVLRYDDFLCRLAFGCRQFPDIFSRFPFKSEIGLLVPSEYQR